MMHLPVNVKSPNNIIKWQVGFNSAFKRLKRVLPTSSELKRTRLEDCNMQRCFETSRPVTSGHQSSGWGGQGSDTVPYLSRDTVHGILFCKLDETWKVMSSLLCLEYLKLKFLVTVRCLCMVCRYRRFGRPCVQLD
jgi:hypothetical protein